MRTAIRKHIRDFAAIIGLVLIAVLVSSVILSNQRLTLPGWVPVIGKDFYEIEAEMQTAQSVTPGQGQTVNVAGVEVGEIKSVKLEDGRAIIGMKIEPRYRRVYRDATVLLRPKTGLKDMVAELTPGTKSATVSSRSPSSSVSSEKLWIARLMFPERLASASLTCRDSFAVGSIRRIVFASARPLSLSARPPSLSSSVR